MGPDDENDDIPQDMPDDALSPEMIPDKEALRQKLYGNLIDRLNGKNTDDLARTQKDIGDSDRQNALMSALSQSANQIGSLHGHVASAAPVSDMAKSMAGEGQQELQGAAQDQGRKDTLDRYLLGQIQRSDSVDARVKSQAAMRTQALAAAAKAAKDKQDFQAAENEKSRQAKIDSEKKHAELMGALNAGRQTDRDNATATRLDGKKSAKLLTLQNSLDPTHASSRSAYGKNQGVIDSADKILAVGDQGVSQEKGLDSRQIHELAMASGNLVSGGTGTAQATVDALVPHSAGSVEARVEEWLTGNPKGTDQMAFVERMLDTAKREKHVAGEKIKLTQSKILHGPAYLDIRDEPGYALAEAQNFDPDNDKFDKNGVYQVKPYAPPSTKKAPPASTDGMAVASPASAMVNIQSPGGDVMSVPKERADYYVKKGGKVVP